MSTDNPAPTPVRDPMPASGGGLSAPDYSCPACACRSFARVQEQKPEGDFRPGPLVRCVHCKRTYFAPLPGWSPTRTDASAGWADMRETLQRIAVATPANTNSATAADMRSWTFAVAQSCLDRMAALPSEAGGEGLREALEPFARCLVDVGESEDDADTFDNRMTHNHAPRITAGDIRRAHAALTSPQPAKELGDRKDTAGKPPMPAHDYAVQWASDTLGGKADGTRFSWGERNLARCYLEKVGRIETRHDGRVVILDTAKGPGAARAELTDEEYYQLGWYVGRCREGGHHVQAAWLEALRARLSAQRHPAPGRGGEARLTKVYVASGTQTSTEVLLEQILLRRIFQGRLDGYTREAAHELARAALHGDAGGEAGDAALRKAATRLQKFRRAHDEDAGHAFDVAKASDDLDAALAPPDAPPRAEQVAENAKCSPPSPVAQAEEALLTDAATVAAYGQSHTSSSLAKIAARMRSAATALSAARASRVARAEGAAWRLCDFVRKYGDLLPDGQRREAGRLADKFAALARPDAAGTEGVE